MTLSPELRALLERACAIPSKESVQANHAGIVDRGAAQAELRALLAADHSADDLDMGEAPAVVGVRISSDGFGSYIADSSMGIGAALPGDVRDPLMTVAQHDRIVACLRQQLADRDALLVTIKSALPIMQPLYSETAKAIISKINALSATKEVKGDE